MEWKLSGTDSEASSRSIDEREARNTKAQGIASRDDRRDDARLFISFAFIHILYSLLFISSYLRFRDLLAKRDGDKERYA